MTLEHKKEIWKKLPDAEQIVKVQGHSAYLQWETGRWSINFPKLKVYDYEELPTPDSGFYDPKDIATAKKQLLDRVREKIKDQNKKNKKK